MKKRPLVLAQACFSICSPLVPHMLFMDGISYLKPYCHQPSLELVIKQREGTFWGEGSGPEAIKSSIIYPGMAPNAARSTWVILGKLASLSNVFASSGKIMECEHVFR